MVINKYVGKLCLVDVKEMRDIISRDTISYLRTYDGNVWRAKEGRVSLHHLIPVRAKKTSYVRRRSRRGSNLP